MGFGGLGEGSTVEQKALRWNSFVYIVTCQGGGVSIKPVTRTPTRHTFGRFSPLNRWTIPDRSYSMH